MMPCKQRNPFVDAAVAKFEEMRNYRASVKHELVVLSEADEQQAVDVMTRSFCGTETSVPEKGFDWAVGAEYHAKWDDPRRVEFFRWYMRWVHASAVKYGIVLGVRDSESGELLSVTTVITPGNAVYVIDVVPTLRNLPRMLGLMWAVGSFPPDSSHAKDYPGATARMDAFGRHLIGTYKKLLPQLGGVKGHWYVHCMAVSPTAQGRGCTRTALDAVAALADLDGRPTYLEANSDRNQAVYTKLGYKTLTKRPIPDPPKAPSGQLPSPVPAQELSPVPNTSFMMRPGSRDSRA